MHVWSYIEPSEFIALYDYQSDVDGDLSFAAGEVITVTEDLGEWFKGRIDSRTGMFPGNFVQLVEVQYSGGKPPPASILPAVAIKPIGA